MILTNNGEIRENKAITPFSEILFAALPELEVEVFDEESEEEEDDDVEEEGVVVVAEAAAHVEIHEFFVLQEAEVTGSHTAGCEMFPPDGLAFPTCQLQFGSPNSSPLVFPSPSVSA